MNFIVINFGGKKEIELQIQKKLFPLRQAAHGVVSSYTFLPHLKPAGQGMYVCLVFVCSICIIIMKLVENEIVCKQGNCSSFC